MQQTSINRPTLKADPLYGLRYIGVSLVALGLVTAVWAIFRRSDISVFIALFMMALFGVMLFWYLFPGYPLRNGARQQHAKRTLLFHLQQNNLYQTKPPSLCHVKSSSAPNGRYQSSAFVC